MYPELVNNELLQEISTNNKICKYIDIPLQHIDNYILKSMNRRSNEEQCRALIKNIKENYPNITIRSTFIIGYPEETNKRFKNLIGFLNEAKLDQVGFFAYSREEGTKAFYLKHQVYDFIKKARVNKIQKIQAEIANKLNQEKIGNIVEVLVDEFDEQSGYYIARTNFQSPNIDFNVLIDGLENVKVGEFYSAKLLMFSGYSFIATTNIN